METTDRIHKRIVIDAPRAKVWNAIADAAQFGRWFRVKLEGPFVAGHTVKGRITHPGYEHLTMELQIERIEPEHVLSFRWHPYAIDPKVDYSTEPTTLVEFELTDVDGGTAVAITESGFDRIPLARRSEAFRMNDGGWAQQTVNLRDHVTAS